MEHFVEQSGRSCRRTTTNRKDSESAPLLANRMPVAAIVCDHPACPANPKARRTRHDSNTSAAAVDGPRTRHGLRIERGERAPIVLADTEAHGELGGPDKRAGKLDLLRTPDQVIT